jgi:hypothetical protein
LRALGMRLTALSGIVVTCAPVSNMAFTIRCLRMLLRLADSFGERCSFECAEVGWYTWLGGVEY